MQHGPAFGLSNGIGFSNGSQMSSHGVMVQHVPALVGKVDFLSAVAQMISHLGLSLDTPQLEQLFHAVSGGRPSVHFEDFIEADSTKYYLQQLAGVIPTTHLEA